MQCHPFISHLMFWCQLACLPFLLSTPLISPLILPLSLSNSLLHFCSSIIPQGDFPPFQDTAAVPHFVSEGLGIRDERDADQHHREKESREWEWGCEREEDWWDHPVGWRNTALICWTNQFTDKYTEGWICSGKMTWRDWAQMFTWLSSCVFIQAGGSYTSHVKHTEFNAVSTKHCKYLGRRC